MNRTLKAYFLGPSSLAGMYFSLWPRISTPYPKEYVRSVVITVLLPSSARFFIISADFRKFPSSPLCYDLKPPPKTVKSRPLFMKPETLKTQTLKP